MFAQADSAEMLENADPVPDRPLRLPAKPDKLFRPFRPLNELKRSRPERPGSARLPAKPPRSILVIWLADKQ